MPTNQLAAQWHRYLAVPLFENLSCQRDSTPFLQVQSLQNDTSGKEADETSNGTSKRDFGGGQSFPHLGFLHHLDERADFQHI